MRDPRQEARRIPHALTTPPEGGVRAVLYHETDGEVPCPLGKDYADAAVKAGEYIKQHYPGRTL